MSEILSSLLPETHKLEVLAGTSSLSCGGGVATAPSEGGLIAAGLGGLADSAIFPGEKSHGTGVQLDAVQAKAIPTNDLAARFTTSAITSGSSPSSSGGDIAGPNITAGHAMAEFVATSGNASAPARSREDGALPKLQFLSEETAIRVVAAVVAPHSNAVETTFSATHQVTSTTDPGTSAPTGEAATSLWDIEENQQDNSDPTPHSRVLRSTFYEYDSSNNSFNGNYDFAPGGVINDTPTVDWNTWGGGGGGYVPLPTDGRTPVVGPPIPTYVRGGTSELVRTVAEIQQQAVEIYGYTANQNHVEFVQIQQKKLITWDSIRDWLAHQAPAKDSLVKVIEQTQGRSYSAKDDNWIAVHQDEIGHGGKSLLQVRQELAKWTAERGGYDASYERVHDHPPSEADRAYAATMIGNGWSVADYSRSEAHGDAVTTRLKEIISAVEGRPVTAGDDVWIRAQQDSLGKGETSLRDIRSSLASAVDSIRETYRNYGGIEPNGDQVSGFMDYLHRGGTVQGMRDPIINVHGPDAIRETYRNYGGIEPNGDQVSGFMDYLHRGGTVQGMRDPIVNVHGPDAIRHAYRDWGGIEPNGDQVSGFMDYLHRGGTVQGMRDPIVNVHGPDAIRHAYRDWGGIEPNGDQVSGFMDYLHRGGTVQGMRDPIVNVHGPDAIRQAYRDAGGIEPNAKQVGDFVDYLRRGGTVQGARGPIAQVHGGDSANHYANTILGHDLSSEQRAQYVDRLAHGAKQSDITYDIVHSASGQRIVQEFVSRYYGVDVDGLSASASNLLGNLAISSHSLMGMTFDSIRQLGEQLQITPGVGNVLDYLSPKDSSDWLKLAAASITLAASAGLIFTPAGEVLVAADLVLVGGAAMLGRAGMILESRFVRETSTGHTSSGKPTKIVDSTGKEHAIEHIANTNAQHSAKHINDAKYPNFSLSKVGINSVSDIARYIKETLTNALSHPERYEVFEDMPRDTLGVWDKENQQATLFQPNPGSRDGNLGTTVRPAPGKQWLIDRVNEK